MTPSVHELVDSRLYPLHLIKVLRAGAIIQNFTGCPFKILIIQNNYRCIIVEQMVSYALYSTFISVAVLKCLLEIYLT